MVTINTISRNLNKLLEIKKFEDFSKNGLQLKAKKEVKKIGFAVDACMSTFKKAKQSGCDTIIVHHGFLWKGQKDNLGIIKEYKNYLKKNKINLYASHLPLDAHQKYGNNIILAKLLDLEDIKPFGHHHKFSIGFKGKLKKSININSIKRKIDKKINTKSTTITPNKKKIKTIAIVSGGGASAIPEAKKDNIDLFITGEAPHHIYHMAIDSKQNIMLSGHYETETLGVKALMEYISKRFKVSTTFIENKTKI